MVGRAPVAPALVVCEPGVRCAGARQAHPTGRGLASTKTLGASAAKGCSWRGAGRGPELGVAGAPGTDPRHRTLTAGTERRALGRRQGFGRFEGLVGRLPGGAFGVGQKRGLVEEGPDAVELGPGGGMQPAEATDAMEAGGQDMLEEPADQLGGFQIEVGGAAGGAVAVGPADATVGTKLEGAVTGGGLEDVAAQVAAGVRK